MSKHKNIETKLLDAERKTGGCHSGLLCGEEIGS